MLFGRIVHEPPVRERQPRNESVEAASGEAGDALHGCDGSWRAEVVRSRPFCAGQTWTVVFAVR